ncbi:phosphotransacetylase family protein [Candidatus Bipolaricaulota bacterium]|nr:phosphotransacetylase family protein [Candidatus Bipolaricaulota bacterium]TFH11308.1 MAG: phosphotransacetylase family protein [Candidatus Atribacteria bacterium]
MKRILIVSTEQHAGKSLLSLALGKSLQEKGLRTAYMKPISFEVSYDTGEPVDRDADAIRSLLSLNDSLRDIAPVPLEGTFLRETIESGDRGFRKRILESFARLAQQRDVVLVEGRSYLGLGTSAGLSDPDLAELLDTDVLLITHYDGEEAIDRIMCALKMFDGPNIMGVILKDVPMDRSFNMLSEVLVSFLASRGAEVLGIIPYDHQLQTVNSEEIVKRLGGRLLTNPSIAHEVRHFVISAMGPEESMRLFRRTPDLCVITGGDRTEIQYAAFDVPSLRCLIVTGIHRPTREIIDLANERGVPIILAGQNTMVTATLCEEMLHRSWIRPGPTLDYAMDYVRYNIDIDRIMEKARDR